MFIIIIKCSFSYGAVRCISAVAGTRTECAVCVCECELERLCVKCSMANLHSGSPCTGASWRAVKSAVVKWTLFFWSSPSTLAVIRAAPSMLDELLPGSVLVVRNEPAIPLDCWLADASESELGPASVEEAFRHRGLRLRVQDLSREMILAQFFTSPHQSPHPHRGGISCCISKEGADIETCAKECGCNFRAKVSERLLPEAESLGEGFSLRFCFRLLLPWCYFDGKTHQLQ